MIEVQEVKTRKQKNQFVDFPTKLYKDNEYYVHPLRIDEMALFSPKKNINYDDCEIIFLLAYKDGKVAGRICGVIQKLYNKKNNLKRARFTRFDTINDVEVAKALLTYVENWAKEKGMTEVHGPLGFNDTEREGLLIEGFDQLATFEENYNFPYYKDLLEECGYIKEIDYIGNKLYKPKEINERLVRMEEVVKQRYKLNVVHEKSKKKFIEKYKQGIFDVLDDAYGDLYGVVPYTDKIRKSIIDQFNLVIDLKWIVVVTNENDEVICFGFAIPSLAEAVRACKGKLFPTGLFKVLRAVKNPKVVDLGLVGIKKPYLNKGVTAIILNYIQQMFIKYDLEHVETNHSLENNTKILSQWDYFEHKNHKRFRCFVKGI